jgi:hypothetical protein
MNEKYIVSVGLMWVSKFKGTVEENGQISGIESITLTSKKGKALIFYNHNGAKSVANKVNVSGRVIKLL